MMMTISVIAPCQSVIASEIERKDVNRFCNLVAELNEEYESDPASFEANVNEDNPNAVENRLIVKAKQDIKETESIDSVSGLDYTILQYEDKQSMEQAYDYLSSKGYTVEKDRILSIKDNSLKNFRTSAIDASSVTYSEMWGYESVGSDYAKAIVESNIDDYDEVVVGVFDTGVDYTHELLADRVIDTSFNMSASGAENDSMDDQGHGSSVAGIIAECTPSNVKIMPYKVVDEDGYMTLSECVAAMEYILNSNNKPDIMNMSIGGYMFDEGMSIETELVAKMVKQGITVCVASGNDNLPVKYCTPADCETAITVGAYDYTNHICSFSNYGEEVDIAAPGYEIYTVDIWKNSGYTTDFSGTSAATPFVSAACAYILMQNNKLSPAEVKEKLKNAAIYMGEDEEQYYGSGMLNFPNLIEKKAESVPIPSVKGGLYHDTQTVEFNNIPADTQLIYTLDKSIPSSSNGTAYAEPILIDNEMQLNYTLIKDNKYASNISSEYYTIQYYLDDSEFEISEKGEITACNSDKNNIVVPDEISGIIPISISRGVFSGSNLTCVVLPDSIESINATFNDCVELKHITAANITKLGGSAFSKCFSLRDEVMPNVKTVGNFVFQECSMLHRIDFDRTLETFNSQAFQYAGILNADFQNLNFPSNRIVDYGFSGCPIISCYIPGLSQFGMYMFAYCNFLQDLYAPDLERIGPGAFLECFYLTEMDFSSLTYISASAFYGCYIDTVYAPNVTKVTYDGSMGIGRHSYIRVIDLPALISISNYFLVSMFVEELYLENVQTMTSYSLRNLPSLNILYMPSVKEFYMPTADSTLMYYGVGPLEIIWIPTTETINSNLPVSISLPNTSKLFYAPNASYLNIETYNTTIVVSDKAEEVYLDPTRESYQNKVCTTIIAPKGSEAEKWATTYEINYIDSDSIAQGLGGEIRTRDSGLRLGFILDESKLGFDISEYKNLCSRINKEYGFAYTYNEISEDTDSASWELRAGAVGAKTRKSDRRDVNGDISHYNIVFTNIPSNHHNDLVSARAYVCIDGMYFYSDVITRSYGSVANAILNDEEMSQNIKDDVLASLDKTA